MISGERGADNDVVLPLLAGAAVQYSAVTQPVSPSASRLHSHAGIALGGGLQQSSDLSQKLHKHAVTL